MASQPVTANLQRALPSDWQQRSRSTRSASDVPNRCVPAGFSLASPDDRARLPLSVRTIAEALACGSLLGHRGAPCVRSAVTEYTALRRARRDVFVAVGRVKDRRGFAHDHAWVLEHRAGAWTVQDPTAALSYEPLVLLASDGAWTNQPARSLPALCPGFFLTMHCQINDKALRGVLDEEVIDDINHMNARVDDPFSHPNYDPREHFDNALITESIALLDDRLGGDGRLHTVHTGVAPAIPHGLACHAIADFYSHTNYAPMALAYYGAPERVLTIDQAINDKTFIDFVTTSWKNASMWQDYDGYSTTIRPILGLGFERCLFSGGYGGDGWTPRDGIPHHNDFAVDQPGTVWNKIPKTTRRFHPFVPPGPWDVQYKLRFRLAVDHLREATKRSQGGDPNPFLGGGRTLPDVLIPPPWTGASRAYLVRGNDGRPEEAMA